MATINDVLLAGKAAGMDIQIIRNTAVIRGDSEVWAPDRRLSDAMQLAIDLRMHITIDDGAVFVTSKYGTSVEMPEKHACIEDAVMEAIVKAAAEQGLLNSKPFPAAHLCDCQEAETTCQRAKDA